MIEMLTGGGKTRKMDVDPKQPIRTSDRKITKREPFTYTGDHMKQRSKTAARLKGLSAGIRGMQNKIGVLEDKFERSVDDQYHTIIKQYTDYIGHLQSAKVDLEQEYHAKRINISQRFKMDPSGMLTESPRTKAYLAEIQKLDTEFAAKAEDIDELIHAANLNANRYRQLYTSKTVATITGQVEGMEVKRDEQHDLDALLRGMKLGGCCTACGQKLGGKRERGGKK